MAATVCTEAQENLNWADVASLEPECTQADARPGSAIPLALAITSPQSLPRDCVLLSPGTLSLSCRFPATWFGGGRWPMVLATHTPSGSWRREPEVNFQAHKSSQGQAGCRSPLAGDCLAVSGLHSLSLPPRYTSLAGIDQDNEKSNNHAFVSQG